MNYKLICTDMDGTLLGNGFEISEENIRALKEAMEKGIKIALVTGRPYNAMKYFTSVLGDNIYIISNNGTYFNLPGYEYKKILSKDALEKIYRIGEKYNLNRHFKGCKRIIANNEIGEEHPYRLVNNKNKEEDKIEIIENASCEILLERAEDEILKCIFFSENSESLRKAKEEFKSQEDLEVVSSGKINFEVMSKGTSKGIALKKFCEILGIDSKEVICIGDNENDISMIEFAGLGIAMGNATDEVKSKADFVTDTNINDGVAKALRKVLA
ncbi:MULTISPECIES: Cof-type HAD-IIB family hydrolase [unclassified Clostridioides]|uniref:Cof-type HAD-IIB family hydrolase n=1 Tax=unclassified Clostridioides TaxID=2635829 RepID=UPI001D0C2027|nr:HAD family phosphatase [Clostridioides sp. ES-S-0049-03]MCC0673731.1 HAD family phosphatase [Clostridioides sp. ES-S-0145-01]MCC0676322.1 HAD family phosphatase [Clostridioides sp. ES-W-0018-02]MCC0711477.1 HAD family phosphatase [Clostridioides sp. ES-W-0017-02]MCC0762781.1 HAD family phosphatase [Clostridioides sp. ES-S-0006-03]